MDIGLDTVQGHRLARLVYKSKATQEMGTLALFDLLVKARQKNASLGITGHLMYADGVFTQCLEGPPDAIAGLWHSLLADPRHVDVELIELDVAHERRFEDWDMAFSSYRHFNEFNMPGFFPLDASGVSEMSEICQG